MTALDEVVADRGYDSHAIRGRAVDADVAAQIPSKRNARDPWEVLDESCRERNRVGRLIGKMKQFRAVATRYDKLGDVFLATVRIALSFIKIRSIVNRP